MKFIFTRVPEFTKTSLNGTHNICIHTGGNHFGNLWAIKCVLEHFTVSGH